MDVWLFGILEFAYFFLSREMLLIATDEMVSTHIALDVLGRTSINALQSSIKTHPLASLKNAHNVNAVKDRLANLNHFASRCRKVQTIFKVAVIIAAIPNNNHIICSPPNSSLSNWCGTNPLTISKPIEEFSESVDFTWPPSTGLPYSQLPLRSGGQRWPQRWGNPSRQSRLPCRKSPAESRRAPCSGKPFGQ